MISIIGAGPSGSNLAYNLAKKGFKVNVYEEHASAGLPVKCTGLVTNSIKDLINIRKKFLVNTIKYVKVFSNNHFLEFKFKNKNFVLDRKEFDRCLVEKAKNAGAEFIYNLRFQNLKQDKKINLIFNKGKKETDYLVGADGPFSQVAKSADLYKNRKFMIGLQARVNLQVNPETIEVYLGKQSFGWVVPEDEKIARLGITSYTNANFHFKELLNKRAKNCKIREYQSGVIPVFNPKQKIQKKNIFLVGDAATQTKATTHGGLIQGLTASNQLALAISKNKNYKKLLKKLNKELKYSLWIRKFLDRLSDKKIDNLISLTKQSKITEILSRHDRDYPSKIIFKLLFKEPRFLKLLI